jgi:peptidoglycan/LPS O-acetylase OafA/YrhL
VVVYHLVGYEGYKPTGLLGTGIRLGYLAVDVFFLLSGFVMTLSYRQLFERRASIQAYAVFLWRRLARIYPLYAVIIALILALQLVGVSHALSRRDLGAPLIENLLLVQAWGFGDSLNAPSWSISTEFAAYLLFPVILLFVFRGGGGRLLLAVVSLCALAYMATLPDPAGDSTHALVPLDIDWSGSLWPLARCLAKFSLGVLTYHVFIGLSLRQARAAAYCTDAIAIVLLALLVVPRTDIAVVILAAILILALAADRPRRLTSRLLACSPIFLFGEISYSIYLLHLQEFRVRRLVESRLLHYLHPQLADSVALAAFFCVLLMSACLNHYFIERPGRSLIRGLEAYLPGRGLTHHAKHPASVIRGTGTADRHE